MLTNQTFLISDLFEKENLYFLTHFGMIFFNCKQSFKIHVLYSVHVLIVFHTNAIVKLGLYPAKKVLIRISVLLVFCR